MPEQSIPGFIAAGLDFPDWVELTAPRFRYAIISTTEDMFPFAGAQKSEAVRRGGFINFLARMQISSFLPGRGIMGIFGQLMPRILTVLLLEAFAAGGGCSEIRCLPPPPPPGASPFAPPLPLPKEAFVDTPTGQVATSFPNAETVHSLNLKRFEGDAEAESANGSSNYRLRCEK